MSLEIGSKEIVSNIIIFGLNMECVQYRNFIELEKKTDD